uniref:Reverse transcriptase domain-containing protein n=1 Tax=Ananas comosus var. bracteatus TaxID=296719 RepID=A0A6V7PL87_ANACO|nr:unnamed protein product [Ananas comosus var. bracteatus]
MCKKFKLTKFAAKAARISCSSSSAASSSADHLLQPLPQQVTDRLHPAASDPLVGCEEDTAKSRDLTLPFSPEEILQIKASCGIVDQGAGFPARKLGVVSAGLFRRMCNSLEASLGVEQVSSDSINLQMIYSSECVDLSCLHLPFTLDEVKRMIFSSTPEKAPGPDGLPMFFYQRFWNLIKDDILDVFNYFYNGAANLQVINTGWVCLLPKRKDTSSAADYRPISLVRSVAKLISKVLATRLQALMNQLINPY